MFKRKAIESILRYILVGLGAALVTWLTSHGVSIEDAQGMQELLSAASPIIVAIIWSFKKNASNVNETESLKEEIKTLKKEMKYND